MKEFSIPMAIVDFIPVILYFLATNIVAKDLKHKMSTAQSVLYRVGTLMVVAAGGLKALYKLLYAAGVGDFQWMSNQMFSNQAFGFLIAGITLTTVVMGKKRKTVNGFIPTMALVGIMVVGLGASNASLAFVSSKMKKGSALACFVVSFFLCMMMGYLSSKNFDKAYMNWAAEGINILGQALLFLGCIILRKAGLEKF